MADWHGYPQHPDAHPERPWWREDSAGYWRRVDGAALKDKGADSLWCITIGGRFTIEKFDAAHPLPPPEPRCGQVWVWEDGDRRAERTVTAVHWTHVPTVYWGDQSVNRYSGGDIGDGFRWPPPGAVLVAGPGAPWAPMAGE